MFAVTKTSFPILTYFAELAAGWLRDASARKVERNVSSTSLASSAIKKFPDTKYLFTAGSAATGMYRGVKFYEAAVKATGGKLDREEVSQALETAKLENGPGGGAEMVPGKMHCKMNMYIAVCKVEAGKTRYEVISKANMVDPKEC